MAFEKVATSRGRSIGAQLVHMHNNRITWLEHVSKKQFDKSLLLDKNANFNSEDFKAAFNHSAQKIEIVIEESWANDGKLPSFKKGLIPFISYLIAHEAHHRGNILLTVKLSGTKLNDALKWGLWDWNG